MEKLLTIVVPVYNTEQYLKRCIDSLIIQEYINQLEILIIIDGSPDNSVEVARKYEEKYPNSIFVIEKENGGHGSTINKGLELATGKYFRILDSDDWFNNDNFALFLSKLSTATEDIVMTHICREYMAEQRSAFQGISGVPFDKCINAKEFDYKNQPIEFFAMARCTFKTILLKKYNLRLSEKVFFEEAYLHVFPLLFLETFIYYDLIIYHYYIGRPGQSVSSDIELRNNSHWQKLIRQIVEFYESHKTAFNENESKHILKIIRTYIFIQYSTMNKFDYNTSYEELKKWDIYVRNLSFSSEIRDWKQILYRMTPYVVFRYLYKIKTAIIKKQAA